MTYSIRLPEDVENRLEKLSAKTGRSKSFYVKEAICEHLNDLENIYLAEKRLEKVRASRTKNLPSQVAAKRSGAKRITSI